MALSPVLVRLLRAAFLWGRGDVKALYDLPLEYREILCQAGIPMQRHLDDLVPPDADRTLR